MAKNIHVRLEYEEAISGKRDVLSSQMDALKILKIIKTYKNLRRKEMILRGKLKNELKVLHTHLSQLQTHLPQEVKEDIQIAKPKSKILKKEEVYNKNIEFQLQDIQDKLERLNA